MRPAAGRTYYAHVEGLRGVAALYVFLYHVWQTATAPQGVLAAARGATWFLQYGHFAVVVFIVISGYCLGLPPANHPERPFSARAFALRRARRLMPAYVAALALSVGLVYVTAALRDHHIPASHMLIGVLTHLALVHNLIPSLNEYLNGPMWSIALECQIYVVFALLLVPVWRRLGTWAQLALALALGLAPHFLLHGVLDWTSPWLLGLFGMGVAAASLSAQRARTTPASAPRVRASVAWRAISAIAGAAALVAVALHGEGLPDGAYWGADLIVGAAVAAFFVASSGERPGVLARVLASPVIVLLGAFSYSLYLLHGPAVLLAGAALARFHAGAAAGALAYALLIVVMLLAAYAFYRVAERPFLSPALREAIDSGVRARPDSRAGTRIDVADGDAPLAYGGV